MTPKMRWQAILVILIIGLCSWRASYTLRYFSLNDAEKAQMTPEQVAALERNSLKLGLDLQGGMHLVLEVNKDGLPADEAADAMDRALEVIRNRIDQFNVSEPSIQREGDNRIIVQLPGLQDEERAKNLIGRTALLEFVPVEPAEQVDVVFRSIDRALADTMARRGELQALPDAGDPGYQDAVLAREHPFSSRARYIQTVPYFPEDLVPWAQQQLARLDLNVLLPRDPADPLVPRVRLGWSEQTHTLEDGNAYRPLYVLSRDPLMTGAVISSAEVRPGLDEDNPNSPGVSLRMNREGGRTFAQYTGEHVGDYLAIVLDSKVQSAPVIRDRIPAGTPASITGGFSDEEARDLAIVLRAGKLPAPMTIEEERTVGPSLGRDSVAQGVRAMIIGFIAVVLFMVIYYKLSGALAIGALVANLVALIAIMSVLPVDPKPALTLPGLAGIILTIGMAVDANVLIFERIKEEIRNQKTIRAAIRDGYDRAFLTILDSNLTTLIAAGVLWKFGTGPVKGFAVTLAIGIAASMFTAIVATRVVYDFVTVKWGIKRLSI
jgi:protein-export membrane protein SecD